MPFLVHSVGRAATSIELARVCMLSSCKPRHRIGYDKNNYRETDGYPSILAFFVGRLEVFATSLFIPCIAVFLKSEVYELEYEASPDVRPRVRETVVRVRVRQAALRPVVRVPTNDQELHTLCHSGMSCFMFRKTYPSDLLVTACLEATRGLLIRIFVFLDVVYNNVKQRFGHLLFRDA